MHKLKKEMLSIVFTVERFEQCVYGRPVKVETDHKPLESIFKKSLISAPKEAPAHALAPTEIRSGSNVQERY